MAGKVDPCSQVVPIPSPEREKLRQGWYPLLLPITYHLTNQSLYLKLNRFVMSFIFFIPLTAIALYESTFSSDFGRKNGWIDSWFRGDDEGAEDTVENRNPVVDDENCRGMEISKVPFEELIKVFPNTAQVRTSFSLFVNEGMVS